MTVDRIAFLLVGCVLPAMVAAIRPHKNPFGVKGRVFCDPCRAGFETTASTYIAGAEVILQCKNRTTNNIVYSKQIRTDSSGAYTFFVDEDKENQICDIRLVSSPLKNCKEAIAGRDQSRVILNRFNGIATNDRFVNNMGFMAKEITKKEVAYKCAKIFRKYQKFDFDSYKFQLPWLDRVICSFYGSLICVGCLGQLLSAAFRITFR